VGNLGGGEILVILLLGLLVLGPARLGVVVQQVGHLVGHIRRVAGGFQQEIRELMVDPSDEEAARERGAAYRGPEAGSAPQEGPEPEEGSDSDEPLNEEDLRG